MNPGQASSVIQMISADAGGGDYFFWNLTQNFEEKSSYICEAPQIDIGCYQEDLGADYNGSASKGYVWVL